MPAGNHLSGRRGSLGLLISVCVALGLGACGPTPPEAPVAQARAVSTALTTIINACGESDQEHAFTAHPDVSSLETTAMVSARSLKRVFERNPAWIYQGKTLRQLARLSQNYLRDCALPSAAVVLAHLQ